MALMAVQRLILYICLNMLCQRLINIHRAIFATFAIGGVILLVLSALFLLFTSLAGALYLGEVLGNNYLGYLIVGIFYLTGIGVLLVLRGRLIQKPILKILINELFPKPKNRRA